MFCICTFKCLNVWKSFDLVKMFCSYVKCLNVYLKIRKTQSLQVRIDSTDTKQTYNYKYQLGPRSAQQPCPRFPVVQLYCLPFIQLNLLRAQASFAGLQRGSAFHQPKIPSSLSALPSGTCLISPGPFLPCPFPTLDIETLFCLFFYPWTLAFLLFPAYLGLCFFFLWSWTLALLLSSFQTPWFDLPSSGPSSIRPVSFCGVGFV